MTQTKPQKRVHVDMSSCDLEGKISDVIYRLQKLRTKHDGADIQIDISADEDYGNRAYVEVSAWYYQDETPEETVEREGKEAQMRAFNERRERQQFEALKKKFGET